MSVLVGPSGGGKSTLLRTLSGANDGHAALVTEGTVGLGQVRYAALDAIPPHLRPGLVRQNVKFLIDTVRENLVSALPNRSSLRRAAQDEVILEQLDRLGLSGLIERLGTAVADLPLVEQRLLAIARITLGKPNVLLVDEPTANLPAEAADRILEALRREALERSVLFVTHHQGHAIQAGGTTYLLAFGTIVAEALSATFFAYPPGELARRFVATGGCARPESEVDAAEVASPGPFALSPSAQPAVSASLESSVDVVPLQIDMPLPESSSRGPRRFFWVIRGRLGGLPRPGIFEDLANDLDGLERVRVRTLVTLEEWESVPRSEVTSRGLELIHFPINDMEAPSLDSALYLCRQIEERLDRKGTVAFHCRGGNGRTGLMLAAQLVFQNIPACEALEIVRSVNPRAIESPAQVSFLAQFERYLKTEPKGELETGRALEL
jgi:atypical dual specificity phosphatase